MDKVYDERQPEQVLNVENVYPNLQVDYTKFKMHTDIYTQSSKMSANTLNDTRIDIFIPPKESIIKNFYITCKYEHIKTDGTAAEFGGDSPQNSLVIESLPSLIDRVYILDGHSSGTILYEITGNAYMLFLKKMADDPDPRKYEDVLEYFHKHDIKQAAIAATNPEVSQISSVDGTYDPAPDDPYYSLQHKIARE